MWKLGSGVVGDSCSSELRYDSWKSGSGIGGFCKGGCGHFELERDELIDEPMEPKEKLLIVNCGPNHDDRRLFIARDMLDAV